MEEDRELDAAHRLEEEGGGVGDDDNNGVLSSEELGVYVVGVGHPLIHG